MSLSNTPSFEKPKIPNQKELINNTTNQETLKLKNEIKQDNKTILNLTYLTTLARLPENRDLDELFDWEVQLWEEELLSIYSLISLINGQNTIKTLKSPTKMTLEWNWAQDYNYDLSYENVKNNWKQAKRIKSITWDWTLPINETRLNFSYDKNSNIDKLLFERPTTLDFQWWWWWVDQEIKIKREKWLVTQLQLLRDLEIDNSLSIKYNDIWKPEIIEQTKFWLMSDKILFEYDESHDLKTIIYLPSLSFKHLKWGNKIALKYFRWTTMKLAQNLWEIVINWVKTTFWAIKRLDSSDIIHIQKNKYWLP